MTIHTNCRAARQLATLLAVGLMFMVLTPAIRASPPSETGAQGSAVFPTPIRHVIVVAFENANRTQVLDAGPYFHFLAERYAQASNFYAACHPSNPNYLVATSGLPWTCGQPGGNWSQISTTNIGDLTEAQGESWSGFMEGMPTPCDNVSNPTTNYLVGHNPFVYYQDIWSNSSRCAAHDVSFTTWNADVASGNIPNFAFISPDVLHDAHSTNVSYGDRWLNGWLSPLLTQPWFQQSVFFIEWDEGAGSDATYGYNGTDGGRVYFTAVSPFAKPGYSYNTNSATYNILTTTEWLLGLGNCGHKDNGTAFPALKQLFSFPKIGPPPLLPPYLDPTVAEEFIVLGLIIGIAAIIGLRGRKARRKAPRSTRPTIPPQHVVDSEIGMPPADPDRLGASVPLSPPGPQH